MRLRSSRQSWCAALLIASSFAVAALTAGCGYGHRTTSPSELEKNPSSFDGQTVTVSGTVRNPGTRERRRGVVEMYELCDSACVNVVQFGEVKVSDGSQLTVTGRFRSSSRRRHGMANTIVVPNP